MISGENSNNKIQHWACFLSAKCAEVYVKNARLLATNYTNFSDFYFEEHIVCHFREREITP
jgi:hypothetical protein